MKIFKSIHVLIIIIFNLEYFSALKCYVCEGSSGDSCDQPSQDASVYCDPGEEICVASEVGWEPENPTISRYCASKSEFTDLTRDFNDRKEVGEFFKSKRRKTFSFETELFAGVSQKLFFCKIGNINL